MRKYIKPGTKLPLALNVDERGVIEGLTYVDDYVLNALGRAPHHEEQVMLDLDQLDLLAGSVAADANHTDDNRLQRKLDRVFRKIESLLDTYTDESGEDDGLSVGFAPNLRLVFDGEPPTEPTDTGPVVVQAPAPPTGYVLPLKVTPRQRDLILSHAEIDESLAQRLHATPAKAPVLLTWDELNCLHDAVGAAAFEARGNDKQTLLRAQFHLTDVMTRYQTGELDAAPPPREQSRQTDKVYVISVELKEVEPRVWRRIAVPDSTLMELHEILQVAMGWENCHLYLFEVGRQQYSDPRFELELENVEDAGVVLLSELGGVGLTLTYEYDFGDGWRHEIRIEEVRDHSAEEPLPRCLEGANACPPEDVGGPPGYDDYLAALADPHHEEHEGMLAWRGPFNPRRFSFGKINQRLR